MAEVNVQDGENIEAALRRFKKEVIKHAIIAEIKRREHYENPRLKKRRKKEEGRIRATFTSKNPNAKFKKDPKDKDRDKKDQKDTRGRSKSK